MRALALILLAGCYSPSIPDGTYLCGPSAACPSSQNCNACGVCVEPGAPISGCQQCGALAQCGAMAKCSPSDGACLQACLILGTTTAQALARQLITCLQIACANRCSMSADLCTICTSDAITPAGACAAQYNACESDKALF
jgi:hypothetical protein